MYAKKTSFGVKTFRIKQEADVSGSAKYITIGCMSAVRYHPKHGNVARPQPTIKMNCKINVNAQLVNWVWVLKNIETADNYTIFSLHKSKLSRSHNCLDEYSKIWLDLNDRVDIQMNKNFNTLIADTGGGS